MLIYRKPYVVLYFYNLKILVGDIYETYVWKIVNVTIVNLLMRVIVKVKLFGVCTIKKS